MSTKRLVFKSTQGLNQLRCLVVDENWDFTKIVPADTEKQIPYQLFYWIESDDVSVVYVDDLISECEFVILTGEDITNVETLIRSKVEIWSTEDIFQSWENADNDTACILAILRLGVAAPSQFDEEYAQRLLESLASGDEGVREASLAAIGYTNWRDLDCQLKDIALNDPDRNCRIRAELMLEIE
jgi:hypothetical protein